MCNLYDIGPTSNRNRPGWEKGVRKAVSELPKIYHIRKTDPAVVARLGETGIQPEIMRWGFHRPFNPSINNARGDKLGGGLWGKAWREKRRCLIPVAAFYEWSGPKGQKQTHAIRAADGDWLWMAGLWEESREHGLRYSMITTTPNATLEPIHNRMPAILSPERVSEYLASDDPTELIRPFEDDLEIFPCGNPLKMRTPSPPIRTSEQGELF